MGKWFAEGTGILSGVHDSDEIDRRIEEDRRKEAAVDEQAAAAELAAAELEELLDRIEKAITVYVGDELQAEFAAQRKTEETSKRAHLKAFLKFKEYCVNFSTPLPYLPAAPAAIAAFLSTEIAKGQGHLNRLCAAIALMHRRVDMPDPTNDPLVRAVVRLALKDKSSPPAAEPS
jgi:hypothetical protein